MCIAIAKPKGIRLSKFVLKNCFTNNPDGAGYAFVKDDKVEIKKGFFTFKDFWKSFSQVQAKNDCAMLVHFRIATHGLINTFNCHPWRIDEQHVMIHNGIIDRFAFHKSAMSDTGHFTQLVLKPMFEYDKEFFKAKIGKCLIEDTIRSWNKAVILAADGEFVIYNESKGQWYDKSWFSNTSFYPRWNYETQSWGVKKKEHKPKTSIQKRYSLFGKNQVLTMKEIWNLTNLHDCLFKELIHKKIIMEHAPKSIDQNQIPPYGSDDYAAWWANRFTLKTIDVN